MKEIFSSLNYELNYKKDSNDIETIQDNLLGEVETGIQILCDSDIDSLTKDSPLHILRALYACKPFAICNENNESFITKENVSKILGYKSDFANIFVYGKDSLSDTYLQARKALYKTIMDLREQREQEHKEEQERISQLSYKEYKEEQKEKERQERFSNRNTANKDSHLILESNDKNNVIIFLDSANSLSNLIHIHNDKIDIFTKDTSTIDIQRLESLIKEYQQRYTESNNQESHIDFHQESKLTLDSLNSSNTQIFLYSQLLQGSSESPSNPLFFGELDFKGEFIESKPIYHLIGEVDSSSIESTSNNRDSINTESNNSLSTLQVFLGSNTLTLLNYSLLDSSLNIKLECNSSESQAIQEKEKAQRDKDSSPLAQNDKSQSTAMLHPLLEDNEIKCPHNGVVQLQSNKGKSITDKNIPFILESDLLNSPIIGCTNNIAGVPTPCTQVALILPSARGLKKYNDDYPIMQDLVSSGVMSDKGFPLICTPKPNSYKINAPSPTHTKNRDKEALKTQIEFHKPILRLHYKEHKSQQDNLPITQFYLFDNLKEQTSPFENLILDYQSDAQSMSDKNLEKELLQSYSNKEYQHKQINLQFGIHQIHLVFIIPQYLPKLFKEPYKDYEHKDYGIGQYKPLLNYSKDIKEYRESTHSKDTSLQSISITHTRVFLSPFKANKLHFTFALGLDDYLDKDNTTELKIIIGGVYDEGEIESDLVATLASNDDRLEYEALEDTKEEKQITEIYFSYGEDKIKLKDISRHSQDINLHIRTQGYEEGEIIKVKLESSTNQTFIVRGRIQNNEAFIMNVLKEIEEER
ncbi:lipase [Helicobacter cinaedi]|uniref:lipase n=14 Tax=Helicobacter cinaedi TaxID=213 RepID=UPI001F3D91B1|nr:lipase [Helicobacter cinaedi]